MERPVFVYLFVLCSRFFEGESAPLFGGFYLFAAICFALYKTAQIGGFAGFFEIAGEWLIRYGAFKTRRCPFARKSAFRGWLGKAFGNGALGIGVGEFGNPAGFVHAGGVVGVGVWF